MSLFLMNYIILRFILFDINIKIIVLLQLLIHISHIFIFSSRNFIILTFTIKFSLMFYGILFMAKQELRVQLHSGHVDILFSNIIN